MATKAFVRNTVAVISIFGHLFVFGVALSLGVMSLLQGSDAIQTLLMASPVLSVIALSAFTHVLDTQVGDDDVSRVSALFAVICIIFPSILIISIMIVFYLFYSQLDGFGPDQLKIVIGAIETFFGVFVGSISKSLFGGQAQREK
jgi:hypothetical protein